jgi:hypothetical protein
LLKTEEEKKKGNKKKLLEDDEHVISFKNLFLEIVKHN